MLHSQLFWNFFLNSINCKQIYQYFSLSLSFLQAYVWLLCTWCTQDYTNTIYLSILTRILHVYYTENIHFTKQWSTLLSISNNLKVAYKICVLAKLSSLYYLPSLRNINCQCSVFSNVFTCEIHKGAYIDSDTNFCN